MQPYDATAPKHVVSLLILYSYHCYMMGSVVHAIQDFGAWVEHIPGECTILCQPVNVGFNKPFKNNVRKHDCNGWWRREDEVDHQQGVMSHSGVFMGVRLCPLIQLEMVGGTNSFIAS